MNERFPFKNYGESNAIRPDLKQAIKDLLAVKIKRLKIEEDNLFIKNINKHFDDLPTDFKERLSIYFDNNLDQDSSLGQELKKELIEIIKDKKNNVELADYEIIDNE
jgi:hypothetical protein